MSIKFLTLTMYYVHLVENAKKRLQKFWANIHSVSSNFPTTFSKYFLFIIHSFFSGTARLWNSLPIECFHVNFDLNGFKSRINRYFSTVGSFWTDFLYALTFLCFFSCNAMPRSGCSVLRGVNLIYIKNVSTTLYKKDMVTIVCFTLLKKPNASQISQCFAKTSKKGFFYSVNLYSGHHAKNL